PQQTAVGGRQRQEALRGQENNLSLFAGAKDDRRGIAGAVILALPQDFATVFVKGDCRCALAASIDQNFFAFDDGGTRDAENEIGSLKLLQRIDLPDLFARGYVKTRENTGDAERVDVISRNCGSCPWSVAVQALEGASRVLGTPKALAVLRSESNQLLFVLASDFGMNEDSAIGDHRRAIAFADRLSPENFRRRGPGRDFFR